MNFEYTHFERPVSSWISGIYYNVNTRELLVNAHLRSYVYVNVPLSVFEEFQVSYSAGAVYNSSVQGVYTPKFDGGQTNITPMRIDEDEPQPVIEEQKTYKVRATVTFEAEVSASSLDEAVKAFLESNKDVPGIEIKEVVVPFGK